MNGVDIVDESTKVNVTSRKVSKISTLIYTYVLDLDMSNTYYIYLCCLKNNNTGSTGTNNKIDGNHFSLSVAN